MSDDPTDYEPRPAHDAVAFEKSHWNTFEHVMSRMSGYQIGEALRIKASKPTFCHQLGIDFNKLPHCI